MSSLSKGNLNEIANLYSGITVKESAEPQQDPQVDVDLSEEVLTEEAILEDSTFIFQLVGSHLIENKMADSEESAIKIMENMSDAWAVEILAMHFSEYNILDENTSLNPVSQLKTRAKAYLKGTISPIIKKRLNISPNQGLMSGVARKVVEKGVDKGTQLAKDVLQGGVLGTAKAFYKQGRGLLAKGRGLVPTASVGAGVWDLSRGDDSWLKGLFKPNYSNAPR